MRRTFSRDLQLKVAVGTENTQKLARRLWNLWIVDGNAFGQPLEIPIELVHQIIEKPVFRPKFQSSSSQLGFG
jgi:hypothetical protein